MQQRTGLLLSGALITIGLVGALTLLFKGHGIMGTTHQFPWGIMISAYVFFALIGSGLCLVSSLGCFLAIEPFTSLVRRSVVLALITLSAAFLIMGLETPQPFNMIYMLFSPNFSAAIFWMGSLYGVYLVFLTSEFWYLIIRNNPAVAEPATPRVSTGRVHDIRRSRLSLCTVPMGGAHATKQCRLPDRAAGDRARPAN